MPETLPRTADGDPTFQDSPALTSTADNAYSHAMRSLVVGNETVNLIEALSSAGVRAMPVKGVVLAAQAYRDPRSRQGGDLDFLISPSDYLEAASVLERLAYVMRSPARMSPPQELSMQHINGVRHFYKHTGQFDLDLHWRLFDERFVPLDFELLWQRSARVTLRGTAVRAPSIEDHLLIVCAHGSKHGWDHLKWVVDVAEMLGSHPGVDSPEVMARAADMHARRMLLLGLALAHRLLGAELRSATRLAIESEPAIEALYRAACDRLLRRLVPHEMVPPALGEIAAARSAAGGASVLDGVSLRYRVAPLRMNQRLLRHQERSPWQTARLLLGNAITPGAREIEMIALPRPLFFLYHCLRVARLLVQGILRPPRVVVDATVTLFRSGRGRGHRRGASPPDSPETS